MKSAFSTRLDRLEKAAGLSPKMPAPGILEVRFGMNDADCYPQLLECQGFENIFSSPPQMRVWLPSGLALNW
jgi:hypothetical protein